ncbi:MAG: hypothetical protein J2P13_00105 [Acidobacteria bacterium]|nr:hypothetical protein [Acidobacteriota bacterium]
MAEVPLVLRQWTDFYVVVGSSAGALTGLQFVVIAIIAQTQAARSLLEIRAFGTPTIVHFSLALLLSATISAPWQTVLSAAVCLALCGSGGAIYILRVIQHARVQTGYTPDAGDWLWHVVLPLAAYLILLGSGIGMVWRPAGALFAIAAIALVLLFIGIHNAWDTVTYVAITRQQQLQNGQVDD